MGVWNWGLYGNDVTADLRNIFREIVRLPLDGAGLDRELAALFAGPSSPEDGSYTSFCLAEADLFHTYGIEAPLVFARAEKILSTGKDLEVHRELGMAERDLGKRAAMLEQLGERLRQPNPKPRKRKILRQPEDWLFSDGEVVVYPTKEGYGANPYFTKRMMEGWAEDGWGMFVVLGAGYRYGHFAYYLILLLPRQGATMPDISALAAGREIPCVANLVELPRAHYPKMRLRSMGTLPILQEAIDSHFLPGTPPFDFLPQHLANVLNDPVPSNFQNRNLSLGRFVRLPD